ncbi:TPA: hypothetical protein SMG93_002642 [Klebsiella oxytoca]|nr:hypothetical protein [Klebsiella oxytoca]
MTSESISSNFVDFVKCSLEKMREILEAFLAKAHKFIAKSKAQFDLWRIRRLASVLSVKSIKFGIFVLLREILSILSRLTLLTVLVIYKAAAVIFIKIKAISHEKYNSSSILLNAHDSLTAIVWEDLCQA